MSLETKIIALAQAVGSDVKLLKGSVGDLTALPTNAKNNLVAAIVELYGLLGSSGAVIDDTAGAGATAVTWSADKSTSFVTTAVATLRTELTAGASAALDTFAELAAALGNDPNFAATIATGLGNRVRVDAAQTFTAAQKLQARSNIDAVGTADIGDTEHDFAADYATAKA
jgi:hypothetical protein